MTEPGRERVRRMPKAELHVHLEGTLDGRTLRRLGGDAAAADLRFRGGGFAAFLEHYRRALDSLRRPEDYGMLAASYLARAPRHGIRHVEFSVSLLSAMRRGHDVRRLLESVQQAASASPVGASLVVDTIRQFGPGEAMRALDAVLPHRDLPVLRGFGMGGDERSVPAARFRDVFDRARERGLRTTVHAGEAGGPEAVREVLDHLRPDRIGHGIAAAAEPELMARLVDEGIPLDVCPTSNLITGVVAGEAQHPLGALVAAGVRVTIGTDDPGLFGTDLTAEYLAAARMAHLDAAGLERIAAESLSGCPSPTGG